MSVHIFGIRHHGPGSARSLKHALSDLRPDIVLIEGPSDAHDEVLRFVLHPNMTPPVALLVYVPTQPQQAVFYPFAVFSPEWQALTYAATHGIPSRFFDLPQANRLAMENQTSNPTEPTPSSLETEQNDPPTTTVNEQEREQLRQDPLASLAHAAGYSDSEQWWEHQFEQRKDPKDIFEAVMKAIQTLREDFPNKDPREAFMRKMIRQAQKEDFQRIAVVCGAWHAPALVGKHSQKEDDKLLRSLPKVKTNVTWIPWTYSRLSYRSGYGAGIRSPGWYGHLWNSPEQAPMRWLVQLAHLLREQDLDASSASVIEAFRLAEALAAMRDRPMAGLEELKESALAVLCHGNTAPMQLVHEQLEVGDCLGEVPSDAPAVPLQRDLESKQKSLRFRANPEKKRIDLDLRKENDRQKSLLLRRLTLLSIPWGVSENTSTRVTGTFHEKWLVQWQPEFAVQLIEANRYGNSVEQACTVKVCAEVEAEQMLPSLTDRLVAVVVAELPEAAKRTMRRIEEVSALSSDVLHLMQALMPLAKVIRYGNVRETNTEQLIPIVESMFERIVIGLPGACSSLDDQAATNTLKLLKVMNDAIHLLSWEPQQRSWKQLLFALNDASDIHSKLRGGCCRILLEDQVFSALELKQIAQRELSPTVAPQQAAAWAEGLITGNALLLIHQEPLWQALNQWLSSLSEETFEELLPLLRRSFSDFGGAERRAMAEKIKHIVHNDQPRQAAMPIEKAWDPHRARLVLPIVGTILGVELNDEAN
jgi:hypothetical protein